MQVFHQAPDDPAFVQNPYPFYARARAAGDLIWWQNYALPAATSHAAVHAILRDKRFGRAPLTTVAQPDHLAPWWAVEQHSMLDAEPPRHTRLRAQVLRAFTSRRVAGLAPDIATLCDRLIADFPDEPFDLLPAYAQVIPVIIIARLLGVPEKDADQLLRWSHAMVAMYQTGRTRSTEDRAASAAEDFASYLQTHIAHKRIHPQDDLLTALIAAKDLAPQEVIGTAILLLNAGHEATVHSLGNAVVHLVSAGRPPITEGTVEECLRFDPPLHLFTRIAYERLTLFGHEFHPGDEVALLLASANRDPAIWPEPEQFNPTRPVKTHHSFGGGLHFCLGAPLARLEMQIALERLFTSCPGLQLHAPPAYANTYHFHGLSQLIVRV